MKYLILIIVLMSGCKSHETKDSLASKKTKTIPESLDFTENKSIYGKWTIQEIIDSLYKDTLIHRSYLEPSKVDTFYLNKIKKLIRKIEMDGNNRMSLFPECEFDKVIGRDAWRLNYKRNYDVDFGSEITLTDAQTQKLLNIINCPLNFSWGECGTWSPSSRFDFYLKGKLVKTLNVGCSSQFRTDYEKIKFGLLKIEIAKEFTKLCNEIGLKNDGGRYL